MRCALDKQGRSWCNDLMKWSRIAAAQSHHQVTAPWKSQQESRQVISFSPASFISLTAKEKKSSHEEFVPGRTHLLLS
uniref:Uncharacterized protein n=1 Tax=Steinernema glaseri TaxID=37863 RepID=A0A1I7ZXJ8_9BILA